MRSYAPHRKRSRAIRPTGMSTMETNYHRGGLQWRPGRAWQLQEDVQNKMGDTKALGSPDEGLEA